MIIYSPRQVSTKFLPFQDSIKASVVVCDLRNYPTQVDETLDLFNELQLQHQTVTTKTKTLHDAFDRLVLFSTLFYAGK